MVQAGRFEFDQGGSSFESKLYSAEEIVNKLGGAEVLLAVVLVLRSLPYVLALGSCWCRAHSSESGRRRVRGPERKLSTVLKATSGVDHGLAIDARGACAKFSL